MGRRTAAVMAAAVTAAVLALSGCSSTGTADRSTPSTTATSTTAPTSPNALRTGPTAGPSSRTATGSTSGATTGHTSGATTGPTSGAAPGPTSGRMSGEPSTSRSASADLWPSVGLPEVNDPSCRDDRPPVLLLHGTFSTAESNFGPLAGGLRIDGRCVFAVNYGTLGTAAVRDSAAQVAAFTRRILTTTGTDQLDVVGYSQGGLVLRTALRLEGLAPLVRTAALLAPSFHGTARGGLDDLPLQLCPACVDQVIGSDLLVELAAGGDLDGAVRYAVLSTSRDDIVVPVEQQVPAGPPDRVRSAQVEDLCPGLVTDHVALPATAAAVSWTVAVLQDWTIDPVPVTC